MKQDEITARFVTFVNNWVGEFSHWRSRGQLLTHVRNLGIASMRFAEKLDELAAAEEGASAPPSVETNWREINGLFRRR